MTLTQRFGYFGIGLTMGIIVLFFFLAGKKTSCSYLPNARVLKNISEKKHQFSPESLQFLSANNLDTTDVNTILENGEIDFDLSEPRKKPCKEYYIKGSSEKKIAITLKNCDTLAVIEKVFFQ